MNPTFTPPTSAAALTSSPTSSSTSAGTLQLQPGMSESFSSPAATQTLSPNALAQLALIPGFISDSAIRAARQEYDAAQRLQRGFGSGASENEIQNVHLPSYSQNTSLEHMCSNPSSSITDLLRQLRETETTSSIAPLAAPTTSWPSAYSSSQAPQPLLSASEDYSNGKVTPQLLKRLADLAEKDTREGRPLFSEIQRLRERQVRKAGFYPTYQTLNSETYHLTLTAYNRPLVASRVVVFSGTIKYHWKAKTTTCPAAGQVIMMPRSCVLSR